MKKVAIILFFLSLGCILFFSSCTKDNPAEPDEEYITLLYPNGGENWFPGDSVEIKWEMNFESDVKIELYEDTVFVKTIVNIAENTSSYSWVIPEDIENTDDYKIKINSIFDELLFDFSDNKFSMKGIYITYPNENEIYAPGDSVEIKWEYSNILDSTYINISLYKNDLFVRVLTRDYSIHESPFVFELPYDIISDENYKFRIDYSWDNSAHIESGSSFDIINNCLKIYGCADDELGTSVCQTNDGGFAILGTSISEKTWTSDIILLKTDAQMNLEWSKIFNSEGSQEGYCVRQTIEEGYVIAGFSSTTDSVKALAIKTDSFGNEIWKNLYEGGSIWDYFNTVCILDNGNYTFGSESRLVLIDPDGNWDTIWERSYKGLFFISYHSFSRTDDGGYITYRSKLDSYGNIEWTTESSLANQTVIQTADGGFVGTSMIPTGGGEGGRAILYLKKSDVNGENIWFKFLDEVSIYNGSYVIQTSDGGYVVSYLDYDNHVILKKVNSAGDEVWSKMLGYSDYDSGEVIETTEGDLVVVGAINKLGSYNDIFLLKLGPDGKYK